MMKIDQEAVQSKAVQGALARAKRRPNCEGVDGSNKDAAWDHGDVWLGDWGRRDWEGDWAKSDSITEVDPDNS